MTIEWRLALYIEGIQEKVSIGGLVLLFNENVSKQALLWQSTPHFV